MAETVSFLQACPAPVTGLLAGEVPGPGTALLHSCSSSLGSSWPIELPNIPFLSLNLQPSFLIQTTRALQLGLV